MPSSRFLPDDAVAAALQVLNCTPDEIAAALGVDLKTLWGYCGGERRAPEYILRRIAALLEHRAALLSRVAQMLGAESETRRLSLVS